MTIIACHSTINCFILGADELKFYELDKAPPSSNIPDIGSLLVMKLLKPLILSLCKTLTEF